MNESGLLSPRPPELQHFVEIVAQTYFRLATDERSKAASARIFSALVQPGSPGTGEPQALPALRHLDEAMSNAAASPHLVDLINAFGPILPRLTWRASRQKSDLSTASANFADGHANAWIAGPSGLEERTDIWLGISLLAPHVRHPDHTHSPEEVYLCLSDGDFRQGDGEWFTPGLAGVFYNEPSISHAMRSGGKPLLAIWALWTGK